MPGKRFWYIMVMAVFVWACNSDKGTRGGGDTDGVSRTDLASGDIQTSKDTIIDTNDADVFVTDQISGELPAGGDVQKDGGNEIGCGICTGGKVCVNGECKCPGSQVDCSGTCTPLGTDTDCSACGDECTNGKACINEKCVGVWTDPVTGYEWQVKPSDNNGKSFTWQEAMDFCKNLYLDGGNWHLPTISELRTLIRGCPATVTGGSCKVTDDCLDNSCRDNSCTGCDGNGPGPGGFYGPSELEWYKDGYGIYDYWSSSSVAGLSKGAWVVSFGVGIVAGFGKDGVHAVRCVRLGP